jgi:glycosyltransferase involved in cell wall biosynthesis
MDVLISTSQGEGWGLQVSEAMACGVPCIVPRWAAFGLGAGHDDAGWTGHSAVVVPCTSTALTAPLNALAYTIGGVPNRATFVEELYSMYRSPLHRQAYRERGIRLAGTLSWHRTGQEFLAVVQSVLNRERDRQTVAQVSDQSIAQSV